MVDNPQKKHLKASKSMTISNRDAHSKFANKCFMLSYLVETDIHPHDLEEIMEILFRQSVELFGIQ